MEPKAAAYTSAGGAFDGDEVLLRDLNVPANRIYLCSNLGSVSNIKVIITAVHELAHYVSGSAILIKDHLHGHFFDPTTDANLLAADPTVSPRALKLPPSLKIRDAEHYASFAFLAARHKLVT